MNLLFEDKTEQVSPNILVASGIELHSLYGTTFELSELLDFAGCVAWYGHEKLVKKVFYDSKACICTFEFNKSLALGDISERTLFKAAHQSISQFIWIDDCVYHKEGSEM